MLIPERAEVLIVEDHPLYSGGVLSLLARHAPQVHCRVAVDAPAALGLLAQHGGADLVLADHRLPGATDGLALLDQVVRLYPTAGRVLMSGGDDPQLATRARAIGAMGYLPKSLEPSSWLAALRSVLAGEPWFPQRPANAAAGLTPRQRRILERIACGQTNKLIARELGITERTIKYHLAEIFERLGATSRAEAVARASAQGWIALPERAA